MVLNGGLVIVCLRYFLTPKKVMRFFCMWQPILLLAFLCSSCALQWQKNFLVSKNYTTSLLCSKGYILVCCLWIGREVIPSWCLTLSTSILIGLFTVPSIQSHDKVALLAALCGTLQLCLFSIPPRPSDTELINQLMLPMFSWALEMPFFRALC